MSVVGTAAATRIRLLGDVAAQLDVGGSGGATVDLGHDRQRCVLAVLLVEPGRPVPVDVLLDRAWGDQLPRHPREALYSYVSRLRQALARVGSTVVRRRGGYLVEIDPLAVDLHLFDHLVRQAKAAADDRCALDRLDEALGLWSGDPFGGLDTPWLNAAREQLNQRRRTAERNRDELALRLGQHAAVVDGLVARADREPLDERLAELALLALYRCGRQAEALDRYLRLRQALVDQVGSEPGPGLRQLYQRMLRADPALAAPQSAPVAHAAGDGYRVPQQLPARPAGFTGRVPQLAELTAALQPASGRAIAVVGGVGGIGKTWLALHWAHQHRQQFPDGQLYVNLRGFEPSVDPVDPAEAIRSFLAALGVPASALPPEPDDQAALFRSLIARRRMLLVLDNARDSAQVVPLLPGTSSATVLITSRRRMAALVAAHGARSIVLDLMTADEATLMLRTRVGAGWVTADPGTFEALVPLCAGLPLALGIVAARATVDPQCTVAGLVAELSDRRTRLDALDALDALDPGDLAVSLRTVMAGSVRTLSAPAARLFGQLSLAPGPDIGLTAAASMAGCQPSALRPLLRELVDANLVGEEPATRYRMHDLVRLYGLELASGTPDAHAAIQRLLDHYLHAACEANHRLDPVRDPLALPQPCSGVPSLDCPRAALAWLHAEYEVLLSAVRYAENAGFHRHAWQLAWALLYVLDLRGNWHAEVDIHRVALRSARQLADDTAMAHAHRGLARGFTWLGRFDEARVHLRAALSAYERLGDQAGQGYVYRSLARVWARQGIPRRALDEDRRALAMFEAAGHDYGHAQALNALGWHHAHLGEQEHAVAHCRRAVALQQCLGDRRGEALTWDTLAYSHHRSGRHEQAAACYRRAAVVLRGEADADLEAMVAEHLGDMYAALGQADAARVAWQRSALLLTELGHPDVLAVRAKLAQLSPATERPM